MVASTLVDGAIAGVAINAPIGLRSAMVLRQGVQRDRVTLVVAICVICDIALIAVGVAAFTALAGAFPAAPAFMRMGGAVLLAAYGFLAIRRAMQPGKGDPLSDSVANRGIRLALTALAANLLNPNFYLDTLVLLGGLANDHGHERWFFAVGGATGGAVWLTVLAYSAVRLRRLFTTARAWRILDGIVALVMLAVAAALVCG